MRISDWSSDVCSSDLPRHRDIIEKAARPVQDRGQALVVARRRRKADQVQSLGAKLRAKHVILFRRHVHAYHPVHARRLRLRRETLRAALFDGVEIAHQHQRHLRVPGAERSEEHTSELQSLMRSSYAVYCSKKK